MLNHEFDILRQQAHFAEELKTTSHLLSSIIPEDDIWHVRPNFGIPPEVRVGRYRVSDQLGELAATTTDLHVVKAYIEEVFETNAHYPAFYEWDIRPACAEDTNCVLVDRGGLGIGLSIPNINYPLSPKAFDAIVQDGFLDAESLTWRIRGEGRSYNWKKDESIFLNVLEKDKVAKFMVASWVLKAVLNASHMYPEKKY